MEQNNNQIQRINYLNFIRIFAIFLTISIHVLPEILYIPVNTNSPQHHILLFIMSLIRIAVPIFFMISGVLLLNEEKILNIKNFYKKSVLKLIFSFLFWSVIYAVVNYFIHNLNNINFIDLVNNITYKLFNYHYHLWYLIDLIVIYCFVPILRLFVKKENIKYFDYLFVIFIILILIKSIFNVFNLPILDNTILKIFPFKFLNNFFFFILGWYLHNKDFSTKSVKILKVLGIISIILLPITNILYSTILNTKTSIADNTFYIFNVFYAIFVFIAFKNNKKQISQNFLDKIDSLSKNVFGVYLVHDFYVHILELTVPGEFILNNYLILPYFIVSVSLVFILSLLTTILIKKYFKKLSKWII